MLIVMQQGATEPQIEAVVERLVDMGFNVHRSTGVIHTLLGGVGGREDFDLASFEVMEGVKEAHRIISPYKLASRGFRPDGTVVKAGGVEIGGKPIVVMAGPANVEGPGQIEASAAIVARAGARVLCARAQTEADLEALRVAADAHALLAATEVTEVADVVRVAPYADIFLVAPRNMQNFGLLRELGRQRKPVLLNRGLAATIEDLLMSAEQILSGGNYDVMLCESGIRTFETSTRNTMDISAVPAVKKLSHLPILGDPSQATGRRDKVAPMARAAVAAGADGLLIEMHPDPDHASTEGAQSLRPDQFEVLMQELSAISSAVGRNVAKPSSPAR